MLRSLWFISVFICGVSVVAAADLPCRFHFKFDGKYSLRPVRGGAERVMRDTTVRYNNLDSQKIVHLSGKTTVYENFALPSAPGELQVRFNIKGSSAGKCTLILNFNKHKGGNGSAGSVRFTVPVAEEWKKQTFYTIAPPDAAAVQFIYTVEGAANTIWINDLYFGYGADSVTFPLKAGDLKAPLTRHLWNPGAALGAFYNLSGRAAVSPIVRMAADAKGLYIAFENPWKPFKKVYQKNSRDQALWWDDCNEVFIHNPQINQGRHFIINANGAIYDSVLFQNQDGDPWKDDGKWNASGLQAYSIIHPDSWESRLFIPWSDLNVTLKDGLTLGINFTAENQSIPESLAWEVGGTYREVSRFAKLTLKEKRFTITRDRKTVGISYTIKRPAAKFDSLLAKGTPGNYVVGVSQHGSYISSFPPAVIAKNGREGFYRWQEELMECWGESGVDGPFFPWVTNNLKGGAGTVEKLHKKYNMHFPLSIHSSAQTGTARSRGAKFFLPRMPKKVAPVDPVLHQVMLESIRRLPAQKNFDLMKKTVSYIFGVDEPFNGVPEMFSKTENKESQAALDELSAVIRQQYGFGKYGLHDDYAEPGVDTPFCRIAFYRWFNQEFLKVSREWRDELRKILPGKPFEMATNNTCGGMAPLDYALFNGEADILSVDPYPTSATYQFGFARGLYHTGFSIKMLRDLAPQVAAKGTLQGFIYCGGRPVVTDLHEWTSQALKNGAQMIDWYCMDSTSNLFDCYREILSINNFVRKMDKLKLPEKPRTAILFSNCDQFALKDSALHPVYSVYSILGEHLKSNFCFVSPTSLARNIAKLDDFKLLYVPRLTYTDPELSAKIKKFAAAGGTVVIFDPRFMSWNIDGTPAAERAELTGIKSITPRSGVDELNSSYGKLKLYANNTLQLPTGMAVESYAINGTTARVIATYADNTPAAVENRYGKGRVIYFASQPFGNSGAVLEPGAWLKFFEAAAKESGSETGLPVWDFLIPAERLVPVKLQPLQ